MPTARVLIRGAASSPFQANPASVRVDSSAGAISAQGLQFLGQGWRLDGDAFTLAGGEETRIRVGDGSAASAGNVATIAVRLGGASRLVKSDVGTLVLTGANDYSGGTRVEAGTLRIGDGGTAGSIVGNVAVDGTLEFARGDSTTFGGEITGGGAMRVASGDLTLAANNGFIGATRVAAGGTLRLGNGGATGSVAGPVMVDGALVFDRSDRFTYAGALTGAGLLRQAGSGMSVLSGASGGFAGDTSVEAGTLVINGTLGGMVSVAGGRLQGGGTIGRLTVGRGGVLAPGNSIGTLAAAGNIGFSAGSTYEVEADAGGASDLLTATGTATLAGGTVSVLPIAGRYALATDYTILTAAGGVSGTFDGATSSLSFLTPSLRYGANAVTLRLTRNSLTLASVGGSTNQRNTGDALDNLASGSVYLAALLLDAAEVRAALDSLSGEVHPSARTAMIEDARLPREAVLRRLASTLDAGRGVWGEGFGNWGANDANGNAARLRRRTGGFVLGADIGNEQVRVGIAGGYTDTDLSIRDRASDGSLKSAHALAYASATFGAARVKAGVGYAHIDIDTHRQAGFTGFSDTLRADYDGRVLQGFGEVGYAAALSGGTVEPFAGIAHVDARTTGFAERGGDAALSVGKRHESYTVSTLGLRLTTPVAGAVSVGGTFGWRHAYGGVTPRTRLSFAAGTPFAVAGAPLSRDAGVADLGAMLRLSDRLTLDVSVTGTLGDKSKDTAARARIGFVF